MPNARILGFIACAVAILTLAGCGSPSSGPPPVRSASTYDVDAIVSAAFKKYDTNSNGTIESGELAASPSLKHFAGKKGAISKDDLKTRITSYGQKGSDSSVVNVGAVIKLAGKPLESTTVTLTPEAFMGSGFEPVSGTTDSAGFVEFRSESGAGIAAGFYTLSFSKKDSSGKETLPAKFNSASKEGREISNGPRGAETIQINLAN
jgi:hypothetical protein